MKNKKLNFIVYIHAVLLLWALLFALSLFMPNGGDVAGKLGVGNVLFLFFNIPFAIVSLVLKAKGYFSGKYAGAVVVLSILNIVVAISLWTFIIMWLM